jgi:hypothetical protein
MEAFSWTETGIAAGHDTKSMPSLMMGFIVHAELPSMMRSTACVLAFILAVPSGGTTADQRRITNASNVRLRSNPSTDASITAELPLGTEFVVVGQTSAAELWYHVVTDDHRDGWVLGSLTTSIAAGRRDQTIEAIVEARLRGGGNFSARVQLFDLIERTALTLNDREVQGRFALYHLRSVNNVFGGVPSVLFERDVETKSPKAEPYGSWIRAHLDASRYNEPAGQWMVDPEYVQAVHEKHRQSVAADDIAWFYVSNGLYGECEGDVVCYVSWQNQLSGWYLRAHPHGGHTNESNGDIALRLNAAIDNLRKFPSVLAEFDPKTRCTELHAALDPLTAAVSASVSTRKAGALAALDRFAQLCK